MIPLSKFPHKVFPQTQEAYADYGIDGLVPKVLFDSKVSAPLSPVFGVLAACRTDVFAALSSKVRMPSAICKLAARRLVPGAEAILGVLKSAVCSMAG
jgi:hypothetical protein